VGNNLREKWVHDSAKRYFDEKSIVLEENVDRVWWECIDKAGMNWTQMYKVWVTKQVSDCCGTNKRLSYWEKHTKAQCSFCEEEETSMHITRCQHPTRRKLLDKTAREILAWMIDSGVGMELADIVYRYLQGHSKVTMRSCLSQGQERCVRLAGDTDALGWDSFIEGRIAKEWGKVSVIEHRKMGTGFQEVKWGATLVDKLLQLTH
jgi:hypothetical protein